MSSDAELFALATRTGTALQRRGLVVTAAESCTGGWIAKALTDVAGSSAWFECGFVTYSNAAKRARLGVSASTLAAHGAVSAAVVDEMVRGALLRSGAGLGVAVSGVAGPGGGSDAKPVGTVWLAWGQVTQGAVTVRTEHCLFGGDRDAVRRATVAHALQGLLDRAE